MFCIDKRTDEYGGYRVRNERNEGGGATHGTSTLEQGLDTLLGDDLAGSVEHALVVRTGSTRGHHHSSPDGVKGVRSETGTGGDSPTEQERGQEGTLERTLEDGGLERVV
jgi:hypothetical protein